MVPIFMLEIFKRNCGEEKEVEKNGDILGEERVFY